MNETIIIILLGILIFLAYSFKKSNTREGFSSSLEDESIISEDDINENKNTAPKTLKTNTPLYQNDNDLKYAMNTIKDTITEKESSIKQPLAPISNNVGKIEEKIAKSKVPDHKYSTRVPDKKTKKDEYHIPMPKFDQLQNTFLDQLKPTVIELSHTKKNIVKYDSKTNKKNKKRNNKKQKNKKNKKKSTISSCRFFKSNKKNFVCPADYAINTGAQFGVTGGAIKCNGEEMGNQTAKAVATVNDGKIERIIITNSGSNYNTSPNVRIIGNGRLGSAYAKINEGKVVDITVTNGGTEYNSTPIIELGTPDGFSYCNLCCKL